MIPAILEYEDGRIKVTANAFMQPELKAILDKHGDKADPYLAYVHCMTALDSPYVNMEEEEKKETIVYDIVNTLGDFDVEDNLLQKAIDKLNKLNTTPVRALFEELQQEFYRMKSYLRDHQIGEDLSERINLLKSIGAILANYKKTEAQVDEEMKAQTRGDQEVGEY